MKIGVVAGEASGDILGEGLLRELKRDYPQAEFVGIGGPRMIAQGLRSLFPQERLAVMGIIEPLKRLPELLGIRRSLRRHFIEHQFDLFIGIDSPAFNTTLEYHLKKAGIKTVHYVSPSVWAWRKGRIKKIKQAVDLMLTLLPFESEIYEQNQIPVTFVGHPLADDFPLQEQGAEAKQALNSLLAQEDLHLPAGPLLACLPGSRSHEVELIGPVFWQALDLLCQRIHQLQVIVPAVNRHRKAQIEEQLAAYSTLPVILLEGHSHEVMAAADGVLLASGTTALEAMLLKKPMVVVYRLKKFSYWLLSKLVKVPYISLPNLLAKKMLVPELIQDDATPEAVAESTYQQLSDDSNKRQLLEQFNEIHRMLRQDASQIAARSIANLINGAS